MASRQIAAMDESGARLARAQADQLASAAKVVSLARSSFERSTGAGADVMADMLARSGEAVLRQSALMRGLADAFDAEGAPRPQVVERVVERVVEAPGSVSADALKELEGRTREAICDSLAADLEFGRDVVRSLDCAKAAVSDLREGHVLTPSTQQELDALRQQVVALTESVEGWLRANPLYEDISDTGDLNVLPPVWRRERPAAEIDPFERREPTLDDLIGAPDAAGGAGEDADDEGDADGGGAPGALVGRAELVESVMALAGQPPEPAGEPEGEQALPEGGAGDEGAGEGAQDDAPPAAGSDGVPVIPRGRPAPTQDDLADREWATFVAMSA